jgi:FkbM family methyltransferase
MKLKVNNPIANQIERFYLQLLHRHPSNTDLKKYLSFIESGKLHLADIPPIMKSSKEYKILKHMEKVKNRPIRTKDGITMYLNPSDKAVSYYLSMDGVWEPYETELMKGFFKNNTNFIDIGAHIGYYSLLGASIVTKGRVISFEPEKENFRILQKNVAINNFKNITLSDHAISDKRDTVDLYLSNEGNTGDNRFFADNFRKIPEKRKRVKITTITLDEFLVADGMKPDIIKMDIQGSEALALKGMKKTIHEADSLMLFTEFWPQGILINGDSPRTFLQSLSDNGFEIYEINSQKTKLEKKSNSQLIQENLIDSNPEKQTDLLCLKNVKHSLTNPNFW